MTKTNKIKPLLIDSNPELGGSFLFDWKTASCHNELIFNSFFFDLKLSIDFNPDQLFPFWKQLNKTQAIIQYEQKMQILISKNGNN
jgi:hypothetical protein